MKAGAGARLRKPMLEGLPGLGAKSTSEGLAAMALGSKTMTGQNQARLLLRRELCEAKVLGIEHLSAKAIAAWVSQWLANGCSGDSSHSSRSIRSSSKGSIFGYGDIGASQWILPVYVDHDRSS